MASFGACDIGPDPLAVPFTRRPTQNIPDGYQADRRNDDLFFTAQTVAKEKGINFADAVDP